MNLLFTGNSFDKVAAVNVIHLLDKPETTMKEPGRICKPNGVIIIPTYVNQESDGKPSIFVKAAGKLGTDFKAQFTYESYKDYFSKKVINVVLN